MQMGFKRAPIALHKRKQSFTLLSNHISTNILVDNNSVNEIPQTQVSESWTTLILALSQGGSSTELVLYKATQMLNFGTKPNGFALTHLVRASTDMGLYSYGQQLQSYILRSGFASDEYVSSALVRSYRRFGSLEDAHKLFVEIPQPSVVCWNCLISGYVRIGQFSKALLLFLQLDESDICADAYAFTAALAACGKLSLLQLGESIHSKIIRYGLQDGLVVGNCLIDMYGKCGCVEEAIGVFDSLIEKDIISWNSVIAATARNGELELAFSFLHQTPTPDTITYNELINGVSQFGNINDAVHILYNMANPNSSSWNSIVTGYINRDRSREALEFFMLMHLNDIEMDVYTFSVILSGIASLAALTWGTLIHCCTMKCGLDSSLVVGSALIDMYAKCGQLKNAETIFQSLPEKNLISWNAMISGYAQNGNSVEVIELFEKLKMVKDLKPDWVTFLNVIAACSNSDVPLSKTIQYFESMIKEYGIEPTVEHCCSMIRLMGQRGEAWRGLKMIYDLSFGSYGEVWKALLGACGTCRDMNVAKIAAAKVIELVGDSDHVYVMISNIFAYYGKWGDVNRIRNLMRVRGVRKEVGCSWIEVESAASQPSLSR
ncbi:putative pentatricopeptide repeat-containing protein [Tripterygium wilfordii]|uniref:Putative pentatricopeptide repeat-containing protein n=1 Tax=Tripterygium wilfordii TaxID=458696 RepID=A0A7J7CK09_TRIWF|nr:putative pentatricopeptide repeat-containing protein At5g47460 [Tripterygium wilfordii]KAF5734407.1 putative pentatricopeptide repeat-containing protein [Tripterygium wilfordii]